MCKPDMDKQLKPDNKPDMELSVHFRNLSVRFKDVVALAPCSGDVPAGELTALMGPTGCGKTSLLNAIARRGPDDLVFPGLTIRETLVFSARLRLADATLAEKLRQVEECIELLRLSHCADAMVGGGMDPRRALRDLAKARSVAVVASIHQPSSRLFLLFHGLLLLEKRGLAYRGPTASAGDAFAGAPFGLPCPPGFSAPDWMMEVVVRGDLAGDAAVAALDAAYGPGTLSPPPALRALDAPARRHRYAAPLSEQAAVLCARAWKEVKPKIFQRTSLQLHVGNATIGGLMWFQLGYRESDIWSRYSLAFAVPIAWVFFPLMDSLGFVPTAEIMLRKELSVNSFRLEAWYLIQTTYLLLPMFAQSMIYLIVFFALSGVSTNPLVFVALYAVVVIALLTFQSIGLLLSAAVKPENLSTCAMLFVTYCFLFTGFFIRLDETAVPWAAFCNPVFYILHLAVWSVFSIDNKRFKCGNDTDDEGTIYVDSCGGGADRNDGKIAVVEIYKQYELRRFEPAIAVLALLLIFLVARLAAFVLLKRRMKSHFKKLLSYEEGKGADAEKPPLNARKSVLSRAEPEAVLLADDAESKESA
ncbi:ATPase [Aureococcus anophagefferens]|nr:ATPase [Aureococcus anophagefferens]